MAQVLTPLYLQGSSSGVSAPHLLKVNRQIAIVVMKCSTLAIYDPVLTGHAMRIFMYLECVARIVNQLFLY